MIKNLENTSFEAIVTCFNEAFSDYSVSMTMPNDYWKDRWAAARISMEHSFGYFHHSELVGLVLHGIDFIEDQKCFFNMGTGVIPAFRGQRIIKQLYNHCYHDLIRSGCEVGLLEVLQDNDKAIKAYESVGFRIERKLNCYKGKFIAFSNDFSFEYVDHIVLSRYQHLQNHYLAWEQNDQTIQQDPSQFEAFEMRFEKKMFGFAIIKKANGNLTQFGVLGNNWHKYGEALFSHISATKENYRILNIDTNDRSLINFLESEKFEILVNQYEMKLTI